MRNPLCVNGRAAPLGLLLIAAVPIFSSLSSCLESTNQDILKAVLRNALDRAEGQYRINVRNRDATEGGMLLTNPQVKTNRLTEAILLPTWPCPLEGRFGTWGGGGKWVCLVHSGVTQSPLTVSVGTAGDVSFETELYNRLNAVIHAYDATLSEDTQSYLRTIPFITFHKEALLGQRDIAATRQKHPRLRDAIILTVPELLTGLNVSFVDILNIDCEGCEFAVVEDLAAHYDRTTVPFRQIMMEIHYTNHLPAGQRVVAVLESLGYRMFHTEWNAVWGFGFEVSFIHESLTRL